MTLPPPPSTPPRSPPSPAHGIHGSSAVGIVVDGINAVLEKRDILATHKKVAPELVIRDSTRNLA